MSDDGFYDDEEEELSFDEFSDNEFSHTDDPVDCYYSYPTRVTPLGTETHRLKYTYESLETIEALLQEKVDSLDMKLMIGADNCTLLLLKYGWNENRLLDDFLSVPSEKIEEEFGIILDEHRKTNEKYDALIELADESYMCMICCSTPEVEELEEDRLHTFHTSCCNHRYCTDCYTRYVQDKNFEMVTLIQCPEPSCTNLITIGELKVLSDFQEAKIVRELARKEAKEKLELTNKKMTQADLEEKYQALAPDDDDYDGQYVDDHGEMVKQLFNFDERERKRNRLDQEEQLRRSAYLKYKKNILLQYTKTHLKKNRYCPMPDCDNIVRLIGFDSDQIAELSEFVDRWYIPSVECKDKHKFCFNCLEPDHSPCPCSFVEKWKIKCKDDSETALWMVSHTKTCPKCVHSIEKNGGCNHMTCRSCHYEFCWICLGKWSTHGTSYYQCMNKSIITDNSKMKDELSVDSFRRYVVNVGLYDNQLVSLRKDKTFLDTLENSVQKMQQANGISWIEAQFYRNCIDILLECRQALVWCYPTLFYFKETRTKTDMEEKVKLLSGQVEKLSKLFEVTAPEKVLGQKKTFVDSANLALKYKQSLITKFLDSMIDELLIGKLK